VESYEVSVPRAEYAREKLGCTVHEELSTVTSGFDVFFSSHVLEHVPSVRSVLDFGFSILRTGGIFVALTPNGSALHRSKDPEGWQHSWGQVHPNLLDDVYYRHVLKDRSFILTADPYDAAALSRWVGAQHNQTALDLSGGELLCAARA
jgi:SAM-dependent methyltransferase